VAVEQEAKARIEPRPAEKLQIGESCFEVERGKYGQGLVDLFDAPAVIEKEQAVDKGALAPGDENVVRAEFGMKEAVRWRRKNSRRSDAVVGHAVEDDVFPCARREIVDSLKYLIRDALQFEGRVEGDDGVVAQSVRDAVTVGGGGDERAGIDAVGNEAHAALSFEAMQQVQDRAAFLVLPVEVPGFRTVNRGVDCAYRVKGTGGFM
jgi:hypothetical protein